MRAERPLEWLCGVEAHGGAPAVTVIAAHPDDETIGAGARIARLAPTCTVIHVTDGAPNDRRFFPAEAADLPRAAYARLRREEAIAALGSVGLAVSRVLCLGARDQEASFDMVALAQRLAALLTDGRPDVVVTHAYEGGHPDHDATAFAVHAAAAMVRSRGAMPPAILEMTSYHDQGGATIRGEFLPAPGARELVTPLTEDDRRRKRAMMAAYATQHEILAPFLTDAERFRLAPRYVFGAPPHDGRLHYERFGFGMSGPMWRALARAATRKLGLGGEAA